MFYKCGFWHCRRIHVRPRYLDFEHSLFSGHTQTHHATAAAAHLGPDVMVRGCCVAAWTVLLQRLSHAALQAALLVTYARAACRPNACLVQCAEYVSSVCSTEYE
jgi:hypothetical protein